MRLASSAAASPRELLLSAQRAANANMPIAAGTMARAALESHLRLLMEEHGIKRHRDSIDSYVHKLYRRRLVSESTRAEIRRLATLGNRFAHNADGTDWWELTVLLDGVRLFIDKNAVDHEALRQWRSFRDTLRADQEEGGDNE